ncbi:hypothetical protein [Brevibacterium sp. FME37]|nr:hypothetical protein [Brevibacterium sp. FME37]
MAMITTLSACSQPTQTPPSATPSTTPTAVSPSQQVPTTDLHAEASKTVVTVMTEYFDTDRSAAEWFDALSPYLSMDAQYHYEDSNVDNIPEGNITGTPQLVSDNKQGLRYFIDTSVGQFTLTLVLEGDTGGSYVVDDITTPDSGEYD